MDVKCRNRDAVLGPGAGQRRPRRGNGQKHRGFRLGRGAGAPGNRRARARGGLGGPQLEIGVCGATPFRLLVELAVCHRVLLRQTNPLPLGSQFGVQGVPARLVTIWKNRLLEIVAEMIAKTKCLFKILNDKFQFEIYTLGV